MSIIYKKQPKSISDIQQRGQKAMLEFESYLQNQLTQNTQNITRIIDYFIFSSSLPTLNILQKTTTIQIFQRICYTINDINELQNYKPKLVESILNFFNDPSDKVRFSAISSIYNIFKFLDDDCLFVFTRTFKQLPSIVIDPSAEVRQAAAHLNHTMKTLLNNAILDHYDFDYEDFINILTQNFLHSHPVIKQFLIDWIITIDQIQQFQSTKYLPLFLKKLFIFLDDQNKNVRIKAQQCLNGYIQAFKLSFTCAKQHITKRYKLQYTQNVLILIIKIIQQGLAFDSSSQIDIHVFTWLDSFCSFLTQQINQGLEPFLSKIFIYIFLQLYNVLIKALSIQTQTIRNKIVDIHQNLLKSYAFLYSHQPQIQKAALSLEQSLKDCQTITKTDIIIKWINRMAENNNEHIHNKIDKYIQFLVQKICQFNQKNLVILFDLLETSIFTSQYFSILIHALLLELSINRTPNQNGILSQIVNLNSSDYNFILLCTEIYELPHQNYGSFKIRLAQTLLGFLITQKSLRDFRQNIKKRKINKNIFKAVALALVQSKPAFIILCFLIRDYETAVFILNRIGEQSINTPFMRSLFKVSNLIMHPAMHQIFLDMGSQSQIVPQARQAYISLLMFLPINRATNPLFQRAKQLRTEDEEIGFVYINELPTPTESQAKNIYVQRYLKQNPIVYNKKENLNSNSGIKIRILNTTQNKQKQSFITQK